jgi:hypothetical protein
MWHSSELGIDAALDTGNEVVVKKTRSAPVRRFPEEYPRMERRWPRSPKAKVPAPIHLQQPPSPALPPPPLRSKYYPRH